jgi:hypothetical protein
MASCVMNVRVPALTLPTSYAAFSARKRLDPRRQCICCDQRARASLVGFEATALDFSEDKSAADARTMRGLLRRECYFIVHECFPLLRPSLCDLLWTGLLCRRPFWRWGVSEKNSNLPRVVVRAGLDRRRDRFLDFLDFNDPFLDFSDRFLDFSEGFDARCIPLRESRAVKKERAIVSGL